MRVRLESAGRPTYMSVRRFLLVISAVAAVVLALERVGVYQFVPAGDIRFQSESFTTPVRSGVTLRNDAGDLTCWIRLIVTCEGPGQKNFVVPTWSGDPLAIHSRSIDNDRYKLDISKEPIPPAGTQFLWRAGLPLSLEITGPQPRSITVEDWAVFPHNQPSDTRAKAERRWWWTRISWVLLLLSVIGTVLTALKEKEERKVVTALTLVHTIIIITEGHDQADTKKLRGFLSKVLLEGTPVREALTSIGLPETETRARQVFLARATSSFLERIQVVVQELDHFFALLSP